MELLLTRGGLDPAVEEDEPETATFCEDELLVNVLNAFIHLVFMPVPPLPPLPLPPDIRLNLLPRLLSCWSDWWEPPEAAATSAITISALVPYKSRCSPSILVSHKRTKGISNELWSSIAKVLHFRERIQGYYIAFGCTRKWKEGTLRNCL